MKKILAFLAFTSLFLTGCTELSSVYKLVTPPNFKANDLVDKKWYCSSSYSTWDLITKEYYTYSSNGHLLSVGTMRILKDGKEFEYKIRSEGIWQLDGWYLFEQAKKASVTKNYSSSAKQALKADPKLAEWESLMFKTLKTMEDLAKKGGRREIETLTPTELTTKAGTSYVICAKQ